MNAVLRLLVLIALAPLAGVAAAAEERRVPTTKIQIEYLRVPDADLAAFRRAQGAEMRDYHRSLSAAGAVAAWYDYGVRFPLGSSTAHNRVVATVFTDGRYIAERNAATTFQKYVVRRELYEPVYALRSPGYETVGSAYSSINFLRAPAREDDFLAHMKAEVMPAWNESVARGNWKTWGVFRRVAADPSAKVDDFSHVAVVRLGSFEDAETPVTMGTSPAAPALVAAELWKLENVVIAGR